MAGETAAAPGSKSLLDRFLGLFTDVKPGEGLLAIIMALNVFLLLLSYYVLKPIRDSLIGNAELFGIGGDELKSYLGAAMAVLLIFVVRGYGTLASRVDRLKLLNITSGAVVACVLVFFVLFRVFHVEGAGIAMAYFVWLGIINVFIVAQFWAYANDIYSEKQGKRLFAMIAIGQSLGAILGAWLSKTYGKQYTFYLLFSAAILLAVSQVLYNVVNRRVAKYGTDSDAGTKGEEPKQQEQPLSKDGGFRLVVRSPYLLAIAFMILVATLFNTNGEYLITNKFRQETARLYPDDMFTEAWRTRVTAGQQALPDEVSKDKVEVIANEKERKEKIEGLQKGYGTSFYGGFYFWVNIVGAFIQMFLVSRIFKYAGVRVALFVLPVIASFGAIAFGLVGSLLMLRISKTAENSLDYSLQNTVKQALFLPTTRDEKYKAKAAIDTFFFRVGDASSALMVFLASHVVLMSVQQFAFANAALGAIWLVLCVRIFREHKRKVPDDTAVKLKAA